MTFLSCLPIDLSWNLSRSLIMGIHPPHPVPALVQVFISESWDSPSLSMASQMSPLEIFSQEQICASEGRCSTPAPAPSLLPLDPRIRSSGEGGRGMLFFTICKSML